VICVASVSQSLFEARYIESLQQIDDGVGIEYPAPGVDHPGFVVVRSDFTRGMLIGQVLYLLNEERIKFRARKTFLTEHAVTLKAHAQVMTVVRWNL